MIEGFADYIIDKTYNYIIFDIGSRDCEQSIEFYKMFPNAQIYAFECNPNTLELCKKNIENYKDRITLIEGAVCDYDGSIKFYPINQQKTITSWKDGNPGASSIFKSNGTYTIEKYIQDEIVTNCHRLDSVMEKYNIPRVDIIWMDLQGAELLALKGLGRYMNDLKFLHTEVSYKEMYSGQVMYKELNDFVLSYDFDILNNINPYGGGWQEDIIYKKKINKTKKDFDIVIPVGPNDIKVLNMQVQYTKKNIIGYRNIYLISYDPTINIDGCITIDEKIFPFTKTTVETIHGKLDRNGWYLQQLLKLYAGIVIDGILERYLVIDADTLFLKPIFFIENDKCLYNYGNEYHIPYFKHMIQLDENFTKVFKDKSGICHHMMFETKYVKEIFNIIESKHNDFFYNVFLKKVTDLNGSGASEYEIYFNYMIKYHSDKIIIRPLKWKNIGNFYNIHNFDYVSYHHHSR